MFLFLIFNWILVKTWWTQHSLEFFGHCLFNKIANSLDFTDFRQIILYFGLSTWTHIEYKIKKYGDIYFFGFFEFIICIPFFVKPKSTFYRTVLFELCKMYTFDQYFWLELLHNKTFDYISYQLVLCKHVVQWHPMYAQKLQN